MSDKLDNLINGAAQVEALGEQSTPWSGIITLIIALALAAGMIYIAGGG
jgi:hypothetical protein